MAMPRTRSRTGSSLQAESDRRAFVVAGVHHELEAPSLELAAVPSDSAARVRWRVIVCFMTMTWPRLKNAVSGGKSPIWAKISSTYFWIFVGDLG